MEALSYLHERKIIYRDLKPENVLIDAKGWPKLVDFGFAKRLKSVNDMTWSFCGTSEYIAPETLLNKGQNRGVDIWSLAIFVYELLTGTPPFASTDPMHCYNLILKGVQNICYPKYMTEEARSLILRLGRREATQRLGYADMDDVRCDEWFTCGDEEFDWVAFRDRTMRPPIRPKVRSPVDTQNFDRFPATDNFALAVDESNWDSAFESF